MKCLVINRIPLDEQEGRLRRKHRDQVNAFQRFGYDTVSVGFKAHRCYIMHQDDLEYVCDADIHGYQSYIAMFNAVNKAVERHGHFDIAYMRMIPATPRLLLFLKHIRPYCKKLVYEFPTYPYDMEMAKQKGIARKVCYHMDRICRHGLKRYIDRAVTFSTNATIFGMKAMSIVNGIGVSDFPEHRPPADRNSITLICVAKLSKWHGFDRLIQGLAVYLKAQNQAAHRVEIEIVGAGEALDSLKALVEQRGLHENVHFHGILVGDTLNDLFAHADIAVESLGLHRIGCSVSSTLKSREYMARGIPFIYSAIIPGIENQPWALKFSPDDCPVDIDQIVSWYEHLPKDQTALLMRAYAEMHLSWESQLSKIIQAL